MSYITFLNAGESKSGKTKVWTAMGQGTPLGRVGWYAPWRKYCFSPNPQTVFDCGCLRDIANFCEERTGEHRGKVVIPKNFDNISFGNEET